MSKHCKAIILLMLFTFVAAGLPAKDQWYDKLDLSTKFFFDTDDDIAYTDYFNLGVELDGRFELTDSWEIGLQIEAGFDKIDAEEIWTRYSPKRMHLQLGMFENEILLEDQFSKTNIPFHKDTLIRRHMDLMGWYSSKTVGLKIYKNYKEDTFPLSAYGHVFFQPAGREVQADAGFYYPYRGEDSWLGFSAAYYPYWVHNGWIGSESTYAQDNNYIFQAVIADLSETDTVIYMADLTLGSNLVDPVGITHIPGEGEASWFLGADLLLGLPFHYDDFVWTPGVNAAYLLYDLKQTESWNMELRAGSQLAWDKTFYLHMEGGTQILTNSDGGESFLQTGLEIVWGISFQIRL
ncbi:MULTISPECIES: hypothetical protein [unclassified Oceanispirochaeta]|uniref:hypothetical protein n=1 Tax=unclassified Oceanispirochaeta TaxID=2635722 RepID=UPI000E096854|nr:MULTISPECIES: hypothetical protein [unclassified Oceanispirochaeta]MBF9017776.1 hypothetical protein [Oceanispirochaeta sp. M2]NPD74340.1 hypothetical protein [Oceanispirochaeta sp. M1]RDG29820.1 hypothetical protein DV872_19755 [Oceanispirochaeta sp. M1]